MFTLSPCIYVDLMRMVEAFKNRQPFTTVHENISNVYKDGLELFVKKCSGLSKFLHELPLDPPSGPPANSQDGKADANGFIIRGPFVSRD